MALRSIPIPLSSNLAAVSYDDDSQTLYIGFRKGGQYAYASVPASVADGFKAADIAAGAYFRANILNQYAYERQG